VTNCKKCGKKKWLKTDRRAIVDGKEVRVWRCFNKDCGHEQEEEAPFIPRVVIPRVLYFDIERSPGESYYYDRKVEYIPTHMLKKEPYIICWAAAWLDGCNEFQYVVSERVRSDEAVSRNDKRILEALRGLMDSADYIVGHNVDGFDIKKVNNRFLQLGIPKPYLYKTIDTLKLSRTHAPFESNGLDYISQKMGGRAKMDIHFEDWKRIVETGDAATLDKAEMYCRGDVREGSRYAKQMFDWLESGGVKVYK
jgi:DNA polymerase elongation subunit (family B)